MHTWCAAPAAVSASKMLEPLAEQLTFVANGCHCLASIDHRARSIITTALSKLRAGTRSRPVCSCE